MMFFLAKIEVSQGFINTMKPEYKRFKTNLSCFTMD